MITKSVAEAKSKFTELLRAVEAGERIVITRHGKPVAELSPASKRNRFSLEAIAEAQRARGLSMDPVPVPEDFDEIEVFDPDWLDRPVDPEM